VGDVCGERRVSALLARFDYSFGDGATGDEWKVYDMLCNSGFSFCSALRTVGLGFWCWALTVGVWSERPTLGV